LLFDENVPLDYSDVAEILDGKIKRGHLVAIEYLMNNFGKDDLLGEDNDEVNFNDSLTVTSGISEGFSTISSSFSIDDQTKSESTTSQNTYCKNRFSDIPFGPYYFIQNIANAIHSSQFSFVCDGYYNGPRQTDVKIKISTHALEDLIKEEEIYTLMKETNLGDNFAECYGLIRNQVHEKIMDGRECSGLILERGIRDLRSYLNPKTWNYFIKNHPDVIRQYTREILTCINALHTAGFCWLDVKPENFVYFRSVVLGMEHYKWKAIDLDSCLVIGTPLSHKVTPRYCPPEVAKAIIEGQISNLKASPTFDSWSAGILILEILDGHHYLNEIEDENKILNVLAGENFVRDLHAHIDARHSHSSSALAERLKALLQEDPKSRELVSGTLKHSFFTGTQATLLVDYKKLTEGVERIESKINDLSNVSSEVQDSIEYLKADIFEEHTTDLKEIVDTLLNNQSAITQVSTKVNNEVSNVLNSDSVVLTKDLVERIVKETTNNIEDIFRARNSPIMEEILLKLDDQKNVFQKMATNEKSTSEDFKQILHCLQD
jgi:serine/threonine protein kinase